MKSAALVEVIVGILIIVAGALGCAWFGYDIATSRSAKKLADQSAEIGVLKGSLALADSVNEGNAAQFDSLKKSLREEKDRRLAIEQANQAELAARAERIALLERAAGERLKNIAKEANEDEDCADLRTLPVCAAVAERLWGDASTARPH